MFTIELDNNEALDIGELDNYDWREVDKRAKQILKDGKTNNEKIAFVAGFLNYVMTMQVMKRPFGSQH